MKTITLFYDYAFNKMPESIIARVIETRSIKDSPVIVLDKTVFYPEGGGQPSDRGTINGIPVIDVREENGEILHYLENVNKQGNAGGITEIALQKAMPSGEVTLKLDTFRRRDITVQHSAQHLLSGIMFRLVGFATVSMHLGEEKNTIDINSPLMDTNMLLCIEDAAAAAIEEDRPFIIHLCPPELIEDFTLRKAPPKGEETLRVLEIGKPNPETLQSPGNISMSGSLDFSPCCGTHVSSTGQIGMLRILEAEKYKGMTRITFIAGRRCLKESRMLRNNAVSISHILSSPVEETGKAVAALSEKTSRLEEQIREYEEEAAKKTAGELLAGAFAQPETEKNPALYAESFSGKEMDELLRIGKHMQKNTGAIIVLGTEKNLKFTAVCSAKGADVQGQFKTIVETTGGKGGGGPSSFQGQFDSIDKYNAFFTELKKIQTKTYPNT